MAVAVEPPPLFVEEAVVGEELAEAAEELAEAAEELAAAVGEELAEAAEELAATVGFGKIKQRRIAWYYFIQAIFIT